MAGRYQPVAIRPKDGGQLMTRVSAETAGAANYTIKRDWRRDLDFEKRREGFDYFWPNVTGDFSANPGLQPFPAGSPIRLIHMARRPNGKTAVIVGTQTTLYRFFALENGAYFEGTGANSYFEEPPALNAPYFETNPGEWITIGSGFSASGNRWEAVDINGYVILNNGVDLPVTYRVEDMSVVPMYELREQGISAVGTIAEFNGMLMLADISEIQSEKLGDLFAMKGTARSGDITMTQAGNTVTASNTFFTAAMVGKTLVYADGTTRQITVFTNSKVITVDGATETLATPQKFSVRTKAAQVGAVFSGLTYGSQTAGVFTMTIGGGSFTFNAGAHNGKTLRFTNGFSGVITVIDATNATLSKAPAATITGLPFYITGVLSTEQTVITNGTTAFFAAGDVGKYLVWDSGQTRKIVAYIDAASVMVDTDYAIPLGLFSIENLDTYAAYTQTQYINRIQYRVMWSMIGEPTRFGAAVVGSITAGSQTLVLNYPVKSLAIGQSISIAGAGAVGGNLTATIEYISSRGYVLLLSTPAVTTSASAIVQRSDAIGSVVGYADLQDDGCGILKMLGIGENTLVIYRDTSIFLANYTGVIGNPFNFRKLEVPASKMLFYRHTLIEVNGEWHLYAGRNSFYRFDLTNRIPQEIGQFEAASDLFYSQATLANTNQIFAADNGLTHEIFFWFPSASSEKAICYDHKFNTLATSSIDMTAAATVKKPAAATTPGETEDWFVMGNASGVIFLYGLVDQTITAWGGKEIYYRRNAASPYSATKVAYSSVMKSGLNDFGDPSNEKDVRGYVPMLASASPDASFAIVFYGCRNTAETLTTLGTKTVSSVETRNLVPVYFRQNYFQDQITVSGVDNPCQISGRLWEVSGVASSNLIRMP